MPKLVKSDLHYADYSWNAVEGDDPAKRKVDADRFSRREGYEVLYLLNDLKGTNGADLTKKTRLICEWMIHEKLPITIQGRSKVKNWIAENYPTLKHQFPR